MPYHLVRYKEFKVEKVVISKDEYKKLLKSQSRLELLESGGVSNWEWYDDVLYLNGDNSIESIESRIDEEVDSMESVG